MTAPIILRALSTLLLAFTLSSSSAASLQEPNERPSGLVRLEIACAPELMRYTVERFAATTGQPVKLVFRNADATDHNLVFVKPGALEAVGTAANEMARNPRNARSNFIPRSQRHLT